MPYCVTTIGQTSRHALFVEQSGFYSGSDQPSIYHVSLIPSLHSILMVSPRGKITRIKYSTSQVGSLAEGCSQASLALRRRTSGCTPKKGSRVMYAETTSIYALLSVLVGTLGDSRETDDNCNDDG